MRLKRLEIYGFKSFPQRTEIVFNQGITGIVGPNGSGKSNIGDAVRWVLGEQSARTLRGAKMEDVIFGGTQKRKSMAFCEVTLAFDNEDGSLALPFSEVAITRRVFRSGEGEYMINQAPCRLKDIVDLFRDTGIGREGYSLIGQGRIDEILSLKSEDRRQVFEEAAGISRYRARKAEAERSLDRTRDNLSRTDDIIKEIEDRLEPLNAQAEQAREYLALTEELKTLDLNLFLINYERGTQRIAGLKAANGEAQDTLLRIEAALRERTRERDENAEAASRLDADAERARGALNQAQTALADAQSARERLSERVSGADDQKRRLSAQLDAARLECLEKEQTAGDDQQAMQECEERVQAAEQALKEAERALSGALADADALSAELDSHREGVLAAINRLSDLSAARARNETMLAQIAARQNEIERTHASLLEGRGALADAFEQAQDTLKATQAQTASFHEAAEQAQNRLRALEGQARAQRDALQNLNAKLRGDESRLRLLREMAASLEGYNQPVRRALSHAENNPRVRGVLARLIRVPRQMEVAIDVALGGALQNIVTDDQETAKELFEYLRQNKFGRITCLPMNAVKGRGLTPYERGLLGMRGCLGVASELIEYDMEYRDIVESLLGRTVVARTLNEGIPIMNAGNRAFRLVTLEGDVMHSGGSMSGGGSGQSRAVSLLGRERETEELRVSVDAQRAELLDGQQSLTALMKACEQATDALKRAQADCHEEEIAVVRDAAALDRARDALKAHDDQIAMTQGALEQLKDSLSATQAELDRLSRTADDTTLDRHAMEEKTQALTRALSDMRLETDTLREAVTRRTVELGECQHVAQDQTRAAQRLQKERDAAQARVETLENELRDHDARTADAQRALDEVDAALHDHERTRAEADEAVRLVEAKRRETQKTITACTQAIDSLHDESKSNADHQHRLQLSLSRAEGDLESICAYIHNTYLLTYADALPYRVQGKFEAAASDRRASELRARVRAMGSVNVSAMDEYAATKARYDDMVAQREDMRKAEEDLVQLIHRLLSRMEKQFTEQFAILGAHFAETFTRLFGGGQAELKLADPDDALECGIDIVAQPPGKKLQMLSLLSGGERALTAIAILFAMLKLKPTPFCILDEIEAALDEANIHYFAKYLSEYAKTTQFVVITHRKGTMERCDALYGVAMQEQGVSGMVSVDLKEYE